MPATFVRSLRPLTTTLLMALIKLRISILPALVRAMRENTKIENDGWIGHKPTPVVSKLYHRSPLSANAFGNAAREAFADWTHAGMETQTSQRPDGSHYFWNFLQ